MQIFVRTRPGSVVAVDLHPNQTVADVRRWLCASGRPLHRQQRFLIGGRQLSNDLELCTLGLPSCSTLEVSSPLLGGGGDGGATGAESRDCYLSMYLDKKPDKVDPNEARLARWVSCRLSGAALRPPCAVDKLGNLLNREAVVHALVTKSVPPGMSHIRGLKDILTIHLTPNPTADESNETAVNRFCCPITGLEFNGKYKFLVLQGCGHVLSQRALKEVKSTACLICHAPFTEDEKIPINGSDEEVEVLRARMESSWAVAKAERAAKKSLKEAKKGAQGVTVGVKRPAGESAETSAAGAERPKGSERVVTAKKFKAVDRLPEGATKEVYASIFTSSSAPLKETYMCRNLPIGRN